MHRRVWLKAYCSNEHYNADCDFAFVDLTPEYVDRILKYHAAFEKAQREFRDLDQMDFWDPSAVFVSYSALSGDELADEGGRTPADDLYDHEMAIDEESGWSKPIEVKEEHCQRTEIDQLVIRHDCVKWTAYPKHCDFVVDTASISIEELRRLAAEMSVSAKQ